MHIQNEYWIVIDALKVALAAAMAVRNPLLVYLISMAIEEAERLQAKSER